MHQVGKLVGRLAGDHRLGPLGFGLIADGSAAGDAPDQIGHGRLAAIGDGAHVGQVLAGIDQIHVLADAGPGDAVFGCAAEIEGAGLRPVAVHEKGFRDPDLLCLPGQGFGPDELGDLGIGTVAGIRQGLAEGLLAVGLVALAMDDLAVDRDLARTGEGSVQDIGHGFQRGCCGDQLEDRAGRVGDVEEAVQIQALQRAVGCVGDGRRVVGVEARGRHGAEDLARFIVVDADGPLPARKGLERDGFDAPVHSQLDAAVAGLHAVGAVDLIEADELRDILLEQERVDISLKVAEQVDRCPPDQRVGCVGLVPVGGVDDPPAPVRDLLDGTDAGAARMGDPVVGVNAVADHEGQKTEEEDPRQKEGHQRASGDAFHDFSASFSGSLTAKLAFCRVSQALRKASMAQQAIMLEPPLETKGKVTPVNGRKSTVPKKFRIA